MPDSVVRVDIVVSPSSKDQHDSYAVTAVIERKRCVPVVRDVSKAQAQQIAKRVQFLLYLLEFGHAEQIREVLSV